MSLGDIARGLLEQALEVYRDNPRAADWLHRHLLRFSEPLRLAVIGPPGSGKSTLVDALAGDTVTQPGSTVDPAWYRVRLSRSEGEIVLIDTPGVEDDASPQAAQNACADADAVLFLARHARNADLGLLRTVHAHPIAMATPVNSVVVLSRADEIGAARVDALISARQIARRFRREPEVRDVCQDVVAVGGQVASAGRTLGEPEFDAIAALAELGKPELDAQLLSADRFLRGNGVLPAETREWLLHRLGIFGLRLATTLARREANSVAALSAQLTQRSGLGELRDAISAHFSERLDVLKARSALIALEVVLRMEQHPAGEMIAADLDRALAGAHDFQELRLLSWLRTGRSGLPEQLTEEAHRLVGGMGTSLPARLGIDYEPSEHERRQVLENAVLRWRDQAENPVLGSQDHRVAQIVLRSCEEMATAL